VLLVFFDRGDCLQEIFGDWPAFHHLGFIIGIKRLAIVNQRFEVGSGETFRCSD